MAPSTTPGSPSDPSLRAMNELQAANRNAPPRYAKTSEIVTLGPNSAAAAERGWAVVAGAGVLRTAVGSLAARSRSAVSRSMRPAASQPAMCSVASLMCRDSVRTEMTTVPAGRYMLRIRATVDVRDRLNETAIPSVVLPSARYRRGPKEDVVRRITSRVVALTSLAVMLVACSGTTASQPPAATGSRGWAIRRGAKPGCCYDNAKAIDHSWPGRRRLQRPYRCRGWPESGGPLRRCRLTDDPARGRRDHAQHGRIPELVRVRSRQDHHDLPVQPRWRWHELGADRTAHDGRPRRRRRRNARRAQGPGRCPGPVPLCGLVVRGDGRARRGARSSRPHRRPRHP